MDTPPARIALRALRPHPRDMDAAAARHAAILGELAELTLSLARKLHGDAMAAETPEQAAVLTREFHRLGRGVRQTLALEARLGREAERQAREAAKDAEARLRGEADARLRDRRDRVRARVSRLIWTEAEREEAEAEALDAALEGWLADPEIADLLAGETPIEGLVADLVARLELDRPPERDEPDDDPPDLTWGAIRPPGYQPSG